MAGAAGAGQQQLLGQVQNQQTAPLPQWLDKTLFNDVPTPDGKLKLHRVNQWMHGISRGGSSLGSNIEGTDPGNGGGGNARLFKRNIRIVALRPFTHFCPQSTVVRNFIKRAPLHHLQLDNTFMIICRQTISFTFAQ